MKYLVILMCLVASLMMSEDAEVKNELKSVDLNGTEKYIWLPAAGTAPNYPMEIIWGSLQAKDGDSYLLPIKTVVFTSEWGRTNSTYITYPRLKKVPTTLSLTYFSYVEDKFFKGDFKIPAEKLKKYFTEESLRPSNKVSSSFKDLIVSMNPEGGVSVWLSSSLEVFEISRFKCEEVDLDWEEAGIQDDFILSVEDKTREEHIQDVLEDFRIKPANKNSKTLQNSYWELLSKRYNYDLVLVNKGKLVEVILSFVNGEKIIFDGVSKNKLQRKEEFIPTLAAPSKAYFAWINSEERLMESYFTIDTEGILKVIEEYSEKEKRFTLQIELSDKDEVVQMKLISGEKVYPIKNID